MRGGIDGDGYPQAKLSLKQARVTRNERNCMPNTTPLTPDCLLLTRPGCHLCEDAEALLRLNGLAVKRVNVDDNPELAARYNSCVPVVFLDGKKRFTGRVDERLLKRLLGPR